MKIQSKWYSGGSPSQRASNAESISIWWRHHDFIAIYREFLVIHFQTLFSGYNLKSKSISPKKELCFTFPYFNRLIYTRDMTYATYFLIVRWGGQGWGWGVGCLDPLPPGFTPPPPPPPYPRPFFSSWPPPIFRQKPPYPYPLNPRAPTPLSSPTIRDGGDDTKDIIQSTLMAPKLYANFTFVLQHTCRTMAWHRTCNRPFSWVTVIQFSNRVGQWVTRLREIWAGCFHPVAVPM